MREKKLTFEVNVGDGQISTDYQHNHSLVIIVPFDSGRLGFLHRIVEFMNLVDVKHCF